MNGISEKIYNLRIRHGFVSTYVATRIGVPLSTYNAMETGNANISIGQLMAILSVYNLTLQVFFAGGGGFSRGGFPK